jgi:hypothetical protein
LQSVRSSHFSFHFDLAGGSKFGTSWFGQYAGLENYESYAPDVVKGFYSMKLQSQLAEELGLE